MINLSHRKSEQGAATLLLTLLLLANITLIVLFAANYSLMGQKITSNQYRNNQAFMAAQAGIGYATAYAQTNYSTITANPVGGHINYSDASTTNVSLANGATFTAAYTNPTANNYNLLLITSTGYSADGTASHTITDLVQQGSALLSSPNAPLITKGNVTLGGNAEVQNHSTNSTVQSGGTVTISASAVTELQSGVASNSAHIGADVTQNSSSLTNLTVSDLFATYFGVSEATFLATKVNHYYSNSSNTNYNSSLNGLTGTIIWIDQTPGTTATINSNTTIGSAANPVILIVNGNFSMTGTANIYGTVYVIGGTNASMLGNAGIIGGLITTDTLSLSGSTEVTYSPTVLQKVQQTQTYYAKVPGSWKDF